MAKDYTIGGCWQTARCHGLYGTLYTQPWALAVEQEGWTLYWPFRGTMDKEIILVEGDETGLDALGWHRLIDVVLNCETTVVDRPRSWRPARPRR